jgi:holliday junction DNA helicase RuvB
VKERLEPYSREELASMAISAGSKLGVEVTPAGARALADGARGTPRILLGHLARARDLAQVEGPCARGAVIGPEVALRALECQGIDRAGLLPIERKLLEVLSARGRPLGLRTLSDLLGESPRTILEVHEPYLVQEGFITRTFRGRIATDRARSALAYPRALDRR